MKKRFLFLTLLLGLALPAFTQVTSPTLTTLTNIPSLVPALTSSNQVSWIALPKAGDIAVSWRFNVATNGGAENCALAFYPSVDGTNVVTAHKPWLLACPANGTNYVTATTNWTRNVLGGYSYLGQCTISNNCAGTLTNLGVIVNRVWNTMAY